MQNRISKFIVAATLLLFSNYSQALSGDIWHEMPKFEKLSFLLGLELGYREAMRKTVAIDCFTVMQFGGIALFTVDGKPLGDNPTENSKYKDMDLNKCGEDKLNVVKAARMDKLWYGLDYNQMISRIDHIYRNPLNRQLYVLDVIKAIEDISNGESQQEVIQAARKRHQESLE